MSIIRHSIRYCRQAGFAMLAIAGLMGDLQAATVSGGSLTLNLNREGLIAGVVLDKFPDTPTASFPICCRPSMYLEEFYAASAAGKTFNQLREENTPDLYDTVSDEISGADLRFSVNGSQIAANPLGRQNQATTFSFDPTNLTGSAAGKIGLGGAMRFRVDVEPPTNRVLAGDMTLEYDPTLIDTATGRSGWVLMNHLGFRASAFDLFHVSTLLQDGSLFLSGELGLGAGFDHVGGIRDSRVGTFSFQTSVVPVPAAVWLFFSGLVGLVWNGGRQRVRPLKYWRAI
jgi:hypothetical protein